MYLVQPFRNAELQQSEALAEFSIIEIFYSPRNGSTDRDRQGTKTHK